MASGGQLSKIVFPATINYDATRDGISVRPPHLRGPSRGMANRNWRSWPDRTGALPLARSADDFRRFSVFERALLDDRAAFDDHPRQSLPPAPETSRLPPHLPASHRKASRPPLKSRLFTLDARRRSLMRIKSYGLLGDIGPSLTQRRGPRRGSGPAGRCYRA